MWTMILFLTNYMYLVLPQNSLSQAVFLVLTKSEQKRYKVYAIGVLFYFIKTILYDIISVCFETMYVSDLLHVGIAIRLWFEFY